MPSEATYFWNVSVRMGNSTKDKNPCWLLNPHWRCLKKAKLLHPQRSPVATWKGNNFIPSTLKWKLSSLLSLRYSFTSAGSLLNEVGVGGQGVDNVAMVIFCPTSPRGPVMLETAFLRSDHFLPFPVCLVRWVRSNAPWHSALRPCEQIGADGCDGQHVNAAHREKRAFHMSCHRPTTAGCK